MRAPCVYERQQPVRFGHCDPAGIVFYPRYFEMLNELVEDWFTHGLGVSFAGLIAQRRIGLPTVRLDTSFQRISRMGDVLMQRVQVEKLGRISLGLRVTFEGPDGVRAEFNQVLVCTSLDTHQPQPLPDDVREALESAMKNNRRP